MPKNRKVLSPRARASKMFDSQEVVTENPTETPEDANIIIKSATMRIEVADTIEDEEGNETQKVYYTNKAEPFSFREATNIYSALTTFMGFDLSSDKIDFLGSSVFEGEKNGKACADLLSLLNAEEKSGARARRTAQLRAQYLPVSEQSKNAAHCASVKKLSLANGVSLSSMLATLQSAGLVPKELTLAEVENYKGKR